MEIYFCFENDEKLKSESLQFLMKRIKKTFVEAFQADYSFFKVKETKERVFWFRFENRFFSHQKSFYDSWSPSEKSKKSHF